MRKDLLAVLFSFLQLIIFGWMAWEAAHFSELARYFPFYIALIATILVLIDVISGIRKWRRSRSKGQPFHHNMRGLFKYVGWICSYIGLIYLVGFMLATAMFLFMFLYVEARLRVTRIALSISIVMVVLLLFSHFIQLYWPQNVLNMMISM